MQRINRRTSRAVENNKEIVALRPPGAKMSNRSANAASKSNRPRNICSRAFAFIRGQSASFCYAGTPAAASPALRYPSVANQLTATIPARPVSKKTSRGCGGITFTTLNIRHAKHALPRQGYMVYEIANKLACPSSGSVRPLNRFAYPASTLGIARAVRRAPVRHPHPLARRFAAVNEFFRRPESRL